MAIEVGEKIPSVTIKTMVDGNMQDVKTDEIFAGKKVVLFAVPGAFTPTCSMQHLPGFIERAAEIKAKGVDTIACISVNDAFVMDAWGQRPGSRRQRADARRRQWRVRGGAGSRLRRLEVRDGRPLPALTRRSSRTVS